MKALGIAAVLACIGLSVVGLAQDATPFIVVFYQDGCNSCEQLDRFLNPLLIEAPSATLAKYEIGAPESEQMLLALCRAYDVERPVSYPIIFVGDDVFSGTLTRLEELAISDALSRCLRLGCESPIARLPISQLRTDLPRLALFLSVFLAIAWFQLH